MSEREFSLIDKYFRPLSRVGDGELGIGDDCAVLNIPPGMRLAVSTDTLVEGVHFPADAPPEQIAYRAVSVALSDLAAMGARARAIMLALTLPAAEDSWLRPFSRGLAEALEEYNVTLVGGDTTRGPLTVGVQVLGLLPRKQALTRAAASVGDVVLVSGPLGDAAAALQVMAGQWPGGDEHREYLLQRFYRPTAQLALGAALLNIASAAIDISDGLLADAGHIAAASGAAIAIDATKVPLSGALLSHPQRQQAQQWALAGGDDYELCFTVPADRLARVPAGCTVVGQVEQGIGIRCPGFEQLPSGYQHF